MQVIRGRRGVALAVASCLLIGLVVVGVMGAGATNSIKEAKAQQHALSLRVESLHYRRDRMRARFHHRIHRARHRVQRAIFKLRAATADARVVGRSVSRGHISRLRHRVRALQHHRKRLALAIHARVEALDTQSASLQNWIDTNGIFQYCPVDGPNELANNFGIIVRLPGVPIHVHEGDDIDAAYGTPIVAPFDGLAVATRSVLAGLSVEVFGPLGHAFNAHLSRYGHLGPVHAGEIIGYVGTTGDATGPHDHFEWHPGNGPAVDPQPYLEKVC